MRERTTKMPMVEQPSHLVLIILQPDTCCFI